MVDYSVMQLNQLRQLDGSRCWAHPPVITLCFNEGTGCSMPAPRPQPTTVTPQSGKRKYVKRRKRRINWSENKKITWTESNDLVRQCMGSPPCKDELQPSPLCGCHPPPLLCCLNQGEILQPQLSECVIAHCGYILQMTLLLSRRTYNLFFRVQWFPINLNLLKDVQQNT